MKNFIRKLIAMVVRWRKPKPIKADVVRRASLAAAHHVQLQVMQSVKEIDAFRRQLVHGDPVLRQPLEVIEAAYISEALKIIARTSGPGHADG
jgi:hypothetical protein